MRKDKLSERDVCTKFITPALQEAGWDIMSQVREEVSFTEGQILVNGNKVTRKKSKRADYMLYPKNHPNLPIALIEAKKNTKPLGGGMQQVLEYAEMLDVPFVYSSNGDGFVEHDRTVTDGKRERILTLDEFPSSEGLWERYCLWKGINEEQEQIIAQPYYVDASGKSPRYYQRIAINRTIEAAANGQDRILLIMATGTGKTYTSFQIIWRLWKSKVKKRILFLADRNILIDQTMTNDFNPFDDKMTKIKKRQIDKSYEIYLALYQGVSGEEDWKNVYKQFSPDFFDLVIIDECHRGSAKADSAWREILEYFHSATQIGLTATPKETKDVSNIDYFGEPVYTYSLKQGIEDGFLAPYKVIRFNLDRDLDGWRPEQGKRDKFGYEIHDRVYNQRDFDRKIVLEKRTELVAKKVTEYLKKTGRFQKTIVFCVDVDHAERMRSALINENADLYSRNHKYIMCIVGDNKEGKASLDEFIDPESTYPVIATTSKLMTTGVDAQTTKLIVLDRHINSMTEFKQIIGRGTRVNEEYDKYFFTIMDFRNVTNLFADPGFDGNPVKVYEPGKDDPISSPDDMDTNPDNEIIKEKESNYKPYVDDVDVHVSVERQQFYGPDGKLITESLKDYTKKTVREEYRSLDDFIQKWDEAEKKETIIQELLEQGIPLDALQEEVGVEYDIFDLICHVAFDQKPLTRSERAKNAQQDTYFDQYGEKARRVINALLNRYAEGGIEDIESMEVLRIAPFTQIGSPMEIIKVFNGKQKYLETVHQLKKRIYSA
ncbi:EcoAI/FtnUII family type I restriction enzme subunit R [Paludifilum halophilum]|uniref:Restriction endonuclease n=1 Tax=Paludifilum halophilum TaxID=1642702 RepID=A0A235B338_9BACL|nr:DEAD/DEAH box helicase family protein [Paludifilum halophilum]OYD06726.1 restriction endonuclease [Paludifilum halophilum]